MHKNRQNLKNTHGQITSFNETALDPVELVKLDELDEASLAAVAGADGSACMRYVIPFVTDPEN